MVLRRALLLASLLLATPASAAYQMEDITCESTSTAGTGSVTMTGALTGGYLPFATTITSGNTVPYNIITGSGASRKIETGDGVFTSPSTLTRVAAWSSDGVGAELTLSGTSTVCLGFNTDTFTAGVLTPFFSTIELGNATANTLSASGGVLSVEGAALLTSTSADALFLTPAEGNAAYQPLDADLTSWALITRAAGFDTFATTPSMANLGTLLTDDASGWITFGTTPSSANLRSLLTDEIGTGVLVFDGTPADDQVSVGDSASAVTWRTIADSDAATQKLQYDQGTNTFSAGTDDDVPDSGDFTNLTGGTGIVNTAGTLSFDATEVTPTVTWGAGSFTTETFDVGATDVAFEFASGTITVDIGGTNETTLTATAFSPGVNDGNALGTASLSWADLFGATGFTIEWDGGTTNTMTCTGGNCSIEGNNFYRVGGTDVAVADGGTGASSLADLITLSTHTTGVYVAQVADGTGVDGTANAEGATYTPSLDFTEITPSATWGAGSFTTMTFDAGATDPVFTFGSGTFLVEAVTSLRQADAANAGGQLKWLEDPGTGSNFISILAPASITSDVTCTLENDSNPIPDSCVGDGSDAGGGGSQTPWTSNIDAATFYLTSTTPTVEAQFSMNVESGARLQVTDSAATLNLNRTDAGDDQSAGVITFTGVADNLTELEPGRLTGHIDQDAVGGPAMRFILEAGDDFVFRGPTYDWTIDGPTGTIGPNTDATNDIGTAALGVRDIFITSDLEFNGSTDTTLTASAAGELTIEGDAVKHAGKQTIWIPASSMTPRVSSGAGMSTYDSGSNDITVVTADFDQTTAEYTHFQIAMPKSWNEGTLTFQPIWTATAGTAAQTMIFSLACVAVSNDDAINGTAMGTVQTSSDALITTNDQHDGPESSAITCAGSPAEGDTVYFQLARDISDTLAADARLIGIKIYWTDNASSDD